MKIKQISILIVCLLTIYSCTTPPKRATLLVQEMVTSKDGTYHVEYSYDTSNRLCKVYEEGMKEVQINYEGDELASLTLRTLPPAGMEEQHTEKVMYVKFKRIGTDTIQTDFFDVENLKDITPDFDASQLMVKQSIMQVLNKDGQLVQVADSTSAQIELSYDSNGNCIHLISNTPKQNDESQYPNVKADIRMKYDDKVNPLQHRLPLWAYYVVLDGYVGKNNLVETSIATTVDGNQTTNTTTYSMNYNSEGLPTMSKRENGAERKYIYE